MTPFYVVSVLCILSSGIVSELLLSFSHPVFLLPLRVPSSCHGHCIQFNLERQIGTGWSTSMVEAGEEETCFAGYIFWVVTGLDRQWLHC